MYIYVYIQYMFMYIYTCILFYLFIFPKIDLNKQDFTSFTTSVEMTTGSLTHHLQLLKLVQESHLLRVYW